ncbi:sugar porter family MFS transporter [Desulfothermobacter acidiphilus]|uniref:sugar porter family MFS transporter n=1 Tax=Desulfothermobacter acidiphilus TaxID=1938353 RepID=UPI003F8938AF
MGRYGGGNYPNSPATSPPGLLSGIPSSREAILNHASRRPLRPFAYVVAAVAAIGGFLFGYDTGVISGALLFVKQEFQMSYVQQEIAVSSVLAGAVLGAALGGRLADLFGRRLMMILTAVIFLTFAFLTSLAQNAVQFMAMRFVVGLAIGVEALISPMYIAEVAPASIRGSLVTLDQLAITVGVAASYLVDYLVSPNWRSMFALAAIPALVLAVGMVLLPESPRWLVVRGRLRKALAALHRIDGKKVAQEELEQIEESIKEEKFSWREFLGTRWRKPLLLGVGLACFQQLTGINTVIYYSPTIFSLSGYGQAAAIGAAAVVGAINILSTIIAFLLVDRWGRRPLLLTGISGMVTSLLLLGVYLGYLHLGGSLLVLLLLFYVFSFAIGLGPVFWLFISEIYPSRLRGTGMSFCNVANWATNLLVSLTFLSLVQRLGMGNTMFIYAGMGVAALLFVYYLVPETKGKTLEEIEQMF